MGEIFAIILGVFTVVGCLLVCFSKNLMHSLVGLFVTLASFAGFYLYLDAPFVAMIQLLIYVGGICVLFLFGIMLTQKIGQGRGSNPLSGTKKRVLIFLAAFVLLAISIFNTYNSINHTGGKKIVLSDIGNLLLGKYLFPFEAVSILLVAALIGAVVLIKKEIEK